MISDILTTFVAPRSARIVRSRLTARRVKELFAEIRIDLRAWTLHREIRTLDRSADVLWSLWIGRFQKPVPWLLNDRFRELRYAFILLLEQDGFVAVLGSNVGNVAERVADGRIGYQQLLALHAKSVTEVESLSTRTLRLAQAGVSRSTQSGRHLEKALPRVGASQTAPFQVAVRLAEEAWRISPGSGRVSVTGKRATIPELCAWFSNTCSAVLQAKEPSDFIKAFAHPIALHELPADIAPSALQLDSTLLDDLLEAGVTVTRNDIAIEDAELRTLKQIIRQLWLVVNPRTADDEAENRWRLKVGEIDVGQITFRTTKISLASDILRKVKVTYDDGTAESLTHVFNSGTQPLRVTFSDPSYAYAANQLFRDHRLLSSRNLLLDILSDQLPAHASLEKREHNGRFASSSLFGFVVETTARSDQYLVCDDIGTEWADFISVDPPARQIAFYHCKGGRVDVGASGLHEVVSQAAKNLGYLSATQAELAGRSAKWGQRWKNTSVPRLQRGETVQDFVREFINAASAPQAVRRVVIVTSALSKTAVAHAFADFDDGAPQPEAVHVLWLLSIFVDQCRNIGAVPEVICRP